MEASPLARRAPLGTLKPGRVSPMRAVPEHIERPEYMFHDGPERVTASDIKTPETIAKIREAGRIAADPVQIPPRGLLLLRDGVGQCFEGPADLLGGLALLL